MLSSIDIDCTNEAAMKSFGAIEAHLAEDLSLKRLAAIAHVSPNYFAAQFECIPVVQ